MSDVKLFGEWMSSEYLTLALDLMEKSWDMPITLPRFYAMIEGCYKQDDDDKWWFQKRHPDIPLIGRAFYRAFTTNDPADRELAKEETQRHQALQETIPWVPCRGPLGRSVKETTEWLADVTPAVKDMNEMAVKIEAEVATEVKQQQQRQP